MIKKPDLSETDFINMIQYTRNEGFLTFFPDKMKTEVESIMKNKKIGVDTKGRSKSEILRGIIFQLWTNCFHEGITFEEFYNSKMDNYIKSIQQITDKIEIDRLDDYYKTKNERR
jgi:hypothetical protein